MLLPEVESRQVITELTLCINYGSVATWGTVLLLAAAHHHILYSTTIFGVYLGYVTINSIISIAEGCVIIGGTKILEPMKEWAWSCFAGILFGIQHLYIMQPIAMVTL